MKNEYDHFLDASYAWGDRAWMNQFFDLLKRMFTSLGINEASPQLGMTVGKDKKLNINIGQRWVLCPWGNERVGLILPMATDEKSLNCILDGFFYNKKKNPEAKWVIYEWAIGTAFPEALYHQWELACNDELSRTKKSAYRKFHSDLFFDAVMNEELRDKIFDDAYSTS